MKTGKLVHDTRVVIPMTLEELGRKIGSSKALISRFEHLSTGISMGILSKICTELNIDKRDMRDSIAETAMLRALEKWDKLTEEKE